jgi:hypothetical protein
MNRLLGAMVFVVALAGECRAATMVDWFSLDPADNLRLLDDSGAVGATLEIVPEVGVSSSLFPLAGSYADTYWMDEPEWMDTMTGDGTLGTFDVQVTPPLGGGFRYSVALDFTAAAGAGTRWFAVGGVFPFAGPTVELATFGVGGAEESISAPLGIFRWDAGFSPYHGPVVWDGLGQVLTFPGIPNEESAFAVFELSAAVRRIEIRVDSPLFPQPGESISFAVGTVIPEVSHVLFLVFASGVGCLLRRRIPEDFGH